MFEYYAKCFLFRICSLLIYPTVKSVCNCCSSSIDYEALDVARSYVSHLIAQANLSVTTKYVFKVYAV